MQDVDNTIRAITYIVSAISTLIGAIATLLAVLHKSSKPPKPSNDKLQAVIKERDNERNKRLKLEKKIEDLKKEKDTR